MQRTDCQPGWQWPVGLPQAVGTLVTLAVHANSLAAVAMTERAEALFLLTGAAQRLDAGLAQFPATTALAVPHGAGVLGQFGLPQAVGTLVTLAVHANSLAAVAMTERAEALFLLTGAAQRLDAGLAPFPATTALAVPHGAGVLGLFAGVAAFFDAVGMNRFATGTGPWFPLGDVAPPCIFGGLASGLEATRTEDHPGTDLLPTNDGFPITADPFLLAETIGPGRAPSGMSIRKVHPAAPKTLRHGQTIHVQTSGIATGNTLATFRAFHPYRASFEPVISAQAATILRVVLAKVHHAEPKRLAGQIRLPEPTIQPAQTGPALGLWLWDVGFHPARPQ